MPSHSPYSFGFGNPVRFGDPSGAMPEESGLLEGGGIGEFDKRMNAKGNSDISREFMNIAGNGGGNNNGGNGTGDPIYSGGNLPTAEVTAKRGTAVSDSSPRPRGSGSSSTEQKPRVKIPRFLTTSNPWALTVMALLSPTATGTGAVPYPNPPYDTGSDIFGDSDNNPSELRIALSVDEYIGEFSAAVNATPYRGWGEFQPKETTIEAYRAAIIELGRRPETTFHFNLSTPRGLITDPVNAKTYSGTFTTMEYRTVSTLFPNKTTYYRKSGTCLLYTSPSPRDATLSRMPSSA